jgi:hypothetical protein
MRTAKYYLLSFLSFLISFIGFIGLKLAIIAVAIGIAFLTEKYIGKFGISVGWIIGLFAAGLLLMGLERLSPYLERLDDYTKTFKQYPYTEKYGKDCLQPKPEDFRITQDEFKDYNKRFQFEYIRFIFTYGLWIAACIYLIKEKIKGIDAIFLAGVAGMGAILLNYLFGYLNKRISLRHRYYEKIHKYQEALNIYFRIRDENSRS